MTQEAQATIDGTLSASRVTADLYETPGGEAYVLEVQLPGLKPEEIVIEADSYSLTVATEPREESSGSRRYIQREQSVRPMSRIFDFPDQIDVDNIRTSLEHRAQGWRQPAQDHSVRPDGRFAAA